MPLSSIKTNKKLKKYKPKDSSNPKRLNNYKKNTTFPDKLT